MPVLPKGVWPVLVITRPRQGHDALIYLAGNAEYVASAQPDLFTAFLDHVLFYYIIVAMVAVPASLRMLHW